MVILATVQGNIGSGKSTLIHYLQKSYKESGKKVCFLQEPVDEWNTIKDCSGTTMIELFYSDQKRFAFGFQMMAYISRLVILKDAMKKGFDIIISERSLDTDRNIFAKMLYDDGKICDVEYQIYMKWFDEFKKDFPDEMIIYVKTTPDVAYCRVGTRGRKGENIPIEYMEKCHEYHEQWICNIQSSSVCELDGNIDIVETPDMLISWKKTIDEFLFIN
jgi:deoxyguanosine kinase